MIYLPNSGLLFAHIPKTGGTWVRLALAVMGVEMVRIAPGVSSHEPNPRRYAPMPSQTIVFTFVRHPLSWYQSYWADRYFRGWGGDLVIAHDCAGMGFNEFVLCCCQRYPGFYSRLVDRFVRDADIVGKTESLRDNLLRILKDAGEQFDESRLEWLEEINATRNSPLIQKLTEYQPHAQRTLLLNEQYVIENWYPPQK